MAGLIQLKEHRWSVAGWVFDHVLRLARPYLTKEESSRILELIDEAGKGLNHISLDDLSRTELSNFRHALEQAYFQIETEGGSSFSSPEFYPGFMERFDELLKMIRSSEETR